MEEAMDKYYLAKTIANDHKKEIDHDLRIRHMLKEATSVENQAASHMICLDFDRHLHTGNARPYIGRRFLKKLCSRFSS
jgi:hypothetical protein